MLEVLSEARAGLQTGRVFSPWEWSAREAFGLLAGAMREHVREWLGPGQSPIFARGRFGMRSEFRFPRATATLMTIILAAVVLTIEQARAIVTSLQRVNSPVGPIHPMEFTVWPVLLLVRVGACVAGAVGWAVLFLLHRSGVQRLGDFDASAQSS